MRTIPFLHTLFSPKVTRRILHSRYLPYIIGLILFVLAGFVARYGFQPKPMQDAQPHTIIVSQAAVHQAPDRFSPQVATFTFGQEVLALPKKKSLRVSGDWIEVHLDQDRSGFVKEAALGKPAIMESFLDLKQSIAGIEPQASGVTVTPTNFRLEPGRKSKVIEKMPAGTRFEMFQRQATFPPSKLNDPFIYKAQRKDVWYKVRLADGRVGYIFTKNFKLEPPMEILNYTRNRRIMAWRKLKTIAGTNGGAADYLAAYATPDADFGADFNRLEGYRWDGEGYQTAFVIKSLRGILPIRVIHQHEDVYFEFAEIDPNNRKQVIVQRYPYAHPYKKVSSSVLQQDVGMH